MNYRNFLIVVALTITGLVSAYGQVIDDEDFTIEIKKAKISSFNFTSSQTYIVLPNEMENLWVRIRITSKSKDRKYFNPNGFSIVSHKHKYRFRPTDVKFAFMMHAFKSFLFLNTVETELEYKYGKTRQENSKDIFLDYSLEGYEDIPTVINFGTKDNPRNKSIYFASEMFSTKTIDYYFGVFKSMESVDLYYKDQKVKTIEIN